MIGMPTAVVHWRTTRADRRQTEAVVGLLRELVDLKFEAAYLGLTETLLALDQAIVTAVTESTRHGGTP